MTPILEARGIVKRFPGVVALSGVSFAVRAGEIHALCGENGAGKSTLIKVLSGVHPAGSYEGELLVDGRRASFAGVRDAEKAGVAAICQELALAPEMSVAENLFLGDEPRRGPLIDYARMRAEAAALLERFFLAIDPDAPVRELGAGVKQLIEILKALRKESRVLILDEPTAALTAAEASRLDAILRDLRAKGLGLVYISHRLDEVFGLADRITVLRDGASVSTLTAVEATQELLIRHMVGREIAELFPRRGGTPGRARLEIKGLSVAPAPGEGAFLRDISFVVKAGEVVGLGGLMGAGRTELLMHLFGAWGRRVSGEVRLDDAPLAPGAPPARLAKGLALVSEDRRRYGLFLDQGVGFNLSLSSLSRLRRRGLVDRAAEARENGAQFGALRVKAPGLASRVGGLSGGNQQKVVLGRVLMTGPGVVLLDEPTRGVDVGAKVEIYEIINRLTAEGKAVLLVSSELPELIGMSDRILMMREGRLTGEFARGASQEELMTAAMGKS